MLRSRNLAETASVCRPRCPARPTMCVQALRCVLHRFMMHRASAHSLATARLRPRPYVRPTSTQPRPAAVRPTQAWSMWKASKSQHRLVVIASSASREEGIALPQEQGAELAKKQGRYTSLKTRLQRELSEVDFTKRLPPNLGFTLLESGIMEMFVKDLRSSDWNVKGYAVQALASVMHHNTANSQATWDELVRAIKAEDTIPILVAMLRQQEDVAMMKVQSDLEQTDPNKLYRDAQGPAAYLLTVLAETHASTVAASEPIPVLVSLLDVNSDGEVVRVSAAKALQWLAVDSRASQDAIVNLGALTKLSAMLMCTLADVQVTAAETLCVLALSNKEATLELGAAGVLHKLPASLRPDPLYRQDQQPPPDTQLAEQPSDVEVWKPRIVQAVNKLNTSEAAKQLVGAMEICALALYPEVLKAVSIYLIDTGAIAALLQAVTSDKWQVKAAAVICLQSLAASYSGILSLVPAEDVVPWLVVLLTNLHGSTDKELRVLVVSRLRDISLQCPARTLESGAVPLLLSLLAVEVKGDSEYDNEYEEVHWGRRDWGDDSASDSGSGSDNECEDGGEEGTEMSNRQDSNRVTEEGLVEGVRDVDESVRLHALEALRNLAQSSKGSQDAIAEAGAIPILKQYLHQSSLSLRAGAIEALGSLALHNKQVQKAMESDEVQCEWDREYDTQIGKDELSTYRDLMAEYYDVNPVYQALSHLLMLWDMGDLPGTVSRPWQPGQSGHYATKDSRDYVERPYGNGLDDQHKAKLVKLARQLSSGDEDEQEAAVRRAGVELRDVMYHVNNAKADILDSGVLAALVSALKSSRWEIRVNALLGLKELAGRYRVLDSAIPAHDVAPVLVELLQQVKTMRDRECESLTGCRSCMDLHSQALQLLAVMSRQYPTTIVEAGCIPFLVDLLHMEVGDMCHEVVSILRRLAMGPSQNHHAIVEAGAIPKLCAVLHHAWIGTEYRWRYSIPGVQIVAAETLYALALNSKDVRDHMVADGSLDNIVEQYRWVSKIHRATSRALMAWGPGYLEPYRWQ